MKKLLYAVLASMYVLAAITAAAEQYELNNNIFYLDLPSGMALVETTATRLSFGLGENPVFLQIKAENNTGTEIQNHADSVMERMGGAGEGVPFQYLDYNAWFGSFAFTHSQTEYQSYLVIISTNSSLFTIIAFCPVNILETYNDVLVSAIDSFSSQEYTSFYPGPIGAFDRYYSKENFQRVYFDLDGTILEANLDFGMIESEDFTINREARILKNTGTIDAWKRFYRMIFRDAYNDLLPAAKTLEPLLQEMTKTDITKTLLRYVQNFTYNRTGTLADIHPPVTAISKRTGDCDTRAIIFLSLLHHFNIDGILLVSTEYAHGLGAVDVQSDGAAYNYEGNRYIIAETTEDVNLGLIGADMANPDYWIPVELWRRR